MTPKFLLDENIPFALIGLFEDKGFQVNHLEKLGKGGIRNGTVYKVAEENDSWIITRDADFKSFLKFTRHNVKGIIVLSLSDTRTQNVLNVIKQFLETNLDKLSSKKLIIIEDRGMKIFDSQTRWT